MVMQGLTVDNKRKPEGCENPKLKKRRGHPVSIFHAMFLEMGYGDRYKHRGRLVVRSYNLSQSNTRLRLGHRRNLASRSE